MNWYFWIDAKGAFWLSEICPENVVAVRLFTNFTDAAKFAFSLLDLRAKDQRKLAQMSLPL